MELSVLTVVIMSELAQMVNLTPDANLVTKHIGGPKIQRFIKIIQGIFVTLLFHHVINLEISREIDLTPMLQEILILEDSIVIPL